MMLTLGEWCFLSQERSMMIGWVKDVHQNISSKTWLCFVPPTGHYDRFIYVPKYKDTAVRVEFDYYGWSIDRHSRIGYCEENDTLYINGTPEKWILGA